MVNSGDQAGALDLYRRALFFRPDHPNTDSTRKEYAEVLMSLELFDEAAQLLGALFNSSESLDGKIDVGLRYANAMREVGRGSDAIYVVLDLLALSDITENQRSKLTSIGTDLIHSELNLEKLSQLWNDVQDIPKWGPFRDLIGFELIARNYHAQKFDLALTIIATETARPNVTYRQRITTIAERISARTTVAKSKVGVLLPLSGRDRVFGRRMRTALRPLSRIALSSLSLRIPKATQPRHQRLLITSSLSIMSSRSSAPSGHASSLQPSQKQTTMVSLLSHYRMQTIKFMSAPGLFKWASRQASKHEAWQKLHSRLSNITLSRSSTLQPTTVGAS